MAFIPFPDRFSRKVPGALLVVAVLLTAACSGSDASAEPTIASTRMAVPGTGVGAVAAAARAFSRSLNADQKSVALVSFSAENAEAWSSLTCGQKCRGGVAFGDLKTSQLTLAKTLLQTALGTGDTGYSRVTDLWAADDELGTLRKGGRYGDGRYDLGLLGTPRPAGPWLLHFGGLHLAINLTYKNGRVAGSSPYFVGMEPATWTAQDGTKYAPLEAMKGAVIALGRSLTPVQKRRAKLNRTFDDVLLGPGADGRFPKKKQGLAVRRLSEDQKDLVLDAIRQWVSISDDETADATMKTYEDELDQTYLGWSGGLAMTAQADYLRIDGPRVWIEFVCQNGEVLRSRIRYHTVWRDHARDYGGEFSSPRN